MRTRHSIARPRQGRRTGAAATEFALLAPLLIVLCLTSVDFGRFAYAYISLGNAVRVGGETGATSSYSSANATRWRDTVIAAVREDFAPVGGLDSDELSVSVEVTESPDRLHLHTVTAAYPFITVIPWPGISRPLQLEREITFRRFR